MDWRFGCKAKNAMITEIGRPVEFQEVVEPSFIEFTRELFIQYSTEDELCYFSYRIAQPQPSAAKPTRATVPLLVSSREGTFSSTGTSSGRSAGLNEEYGYLDPPTVRGCSRSGLCSGGGSEYSIVVNAVVMGYALLERHTVF